MSKFKCPIIKTRVLDFDYLDLFRISDFVLRILRIGRSSGTRGEEASGLCSSGKPRFSLSSGPAGNAGGPLSIWNDVLSVLHP